MVTEGHSDLCGAHHPSTNFTLQLNCSLYWNAATLHFQDLNTENHKAHNDTQCPSKSGASQEKAELPAGWSSDSQQESAPDLHFYAGEWTKLHHILSMV